jgi:hypothetical protein
VQGLTNLGVEFLKLDTSMEARTADEYTRYIQHMADGLEPDLFHSLNDTDQQHILHLLHKSRTVKGDSNYLYFHDFVQKINRGICTTIMTVGGSLTCGTALAERSFNEKPWPTLLERYLNQMFPCFEDTNTNHSVSGRRELLSDASLNERYALLRSNVSIETEKKLGRHRVENRCVVGTGSSFSSRNFELLFCDLADQLDLVIMELASNDLVDNEAIVVMQDVKGNLTESAPKYIEFLIRKLDSLNIPHMFLQGSFRC